MNAAEWMEYTQTVMRGHKVRSIQYGTIAGLGDTGEAVWFNLPEADEAIVFYLSQGQLTHERVQFVEGEEEVGEL